MARHLLTVTVVVPYAGADVDGATRDVMAIVQTAVARGAVRGVDTADDAVAVDYETERVDERDEDDEDDDGDDRAAAGPPVGDAPTAAVVSCFCGQKNRVPVAGARMGVGGWFVTLKPARCGRCQSALPPGEQYLAGV